MPIWILVPFVGKVAISTAAALWGGGAVAAGTAAVTTHKNSKAKRKVAEANRLLADADDEMEQLVQKLNQQYRKFFGQSLDRYKVAYDKLREAMSDASETVSPTVKRPSRFVFRSGLSKADLRAIGFDDIDWEKVNRTSAEAMRATFYAFRGSNPSAAANTNAAGAGMAAGGIVAAGSIMAGFIDAAEKRVTEATEMLATAETHAARVKAQKRMFRKSVREDIAAREEALDQLFAIIDVELEKNSPFPQLEHILVAAGSIISRRCFPRAKKK